MSGKQRKRSRRTAKDNGTRMESAVESYLQWALDDLRIQRLRLHGSKDIGDIGNVFFHGRPVCIEVKWTQTMNAPQHMREAIREAGNMDSPYPWVVQKKSGRRPYLDQQAGPTARLHDIGNIGCDARPIATAHTGDHQTGTTRKEENHATYHIAGVRHDAERRPLAWPR